MQWNVDRKIRGKTLSKLFWIFYAISILFFHPTAFLSSCWKRSVSRSRSFLLFHEGRQHVLENDEFTKKSTWVLLGGECLMWRMYCVAMPNLLLELYHFFSFALPFIVYTKTSSVKPTSKLQTMYVRKLDSQRFSWRDKKKVLYNIVCTTGYTQL
jgi:hypothetical protein